MPKKVTRGRKKMTGGKRKTTRRRVSRRSQTGNGLFSSFLSAALPKVIKYGPLVAGIAGGVGGLGAGISTMVKNNAEKDALNRLS